MSLKDSHNHHSEYSKIIVSLAHPSLKLAPRSWPLELGTFASPDHSWDSHIFGTCPEVTVNMLYGLAPNSPQESAPLPSSLVEMASLNQASLSCIQGVHKRSRNANPEP